MYYPLLNKTLFLDSYTRKGSTHQVNQDYVLTDDEAGLAVVCDGCSSAVHVDVGARLLAWASLNGTVEEVPAIAKQLGLPDEALYATILRLGFDAATGRFDVSINGDGLFFALIDNLLVVDEICFTDNAPAYPAYDLFKKVGIYEEAYPDNSCYENGYFYNWPKMTKHSQSSQDINNPVNFSYTSECRFIGLASDGLNSFIDRAGNPVPFDEIAKEIFAFKNFNGEFVKRRMESAFKEFARKGWVNQDDFSLAVFSIVSDADRLI